MKPLKFKDVAHQSWDSCGGVPEAYKIDWSRNEEKYKNVARQSEVRVYQGGRVSLHTNGYRDPDLRKKLLHEYGLDLQVTAQIRGLKFFTPDGDPVPKNKIKEEILLLDHEHKIALRGREIHWVDTGYAPKSDQKITTRSRDKKKEAEFKDRWSEALNLAVTMFTLDKEPTGSRFYQYSVLVTYRNWLRTPKMLDPVNDKTSLLHLGCVQMQYKKTFEKELISSCETVSELEYLRFEERKV